MCFIYIAGPDGSGKTTQTKLLLQYFESLGMCPRHLWLRFPFALSLPFLAYARLRGYSRYEEVGGVRHGYWDFKRSWLMAAVFPWVYLGDAAIASVLQTWASRRHRTVVVCERFVLDMLVDVAVAVDKPSLIEGALGRAFLRLLPRGTRLVVLDLDAETIRARRPDLVWDKNLERRIEAYQLMARKYSLDTVCTSKGPVLTAGEILKSLGIGQAHGEALLPH